jgi:glycosyltransferase involved in cell wall biosynthesis
MSLVLTTNMETLKLARAMGAKRVEPWFDAALPEEFFTETPRVFTPQTGPVRLLWIGRMVPRKALPLALDVLTKTSSGATLTIVGSGLPEAEVHRMIRDRGLEERVHWAGRRLDRDEVRRAYLEHDALLFASLRDSCPAQLLEAMGLGLPVIILDHHGARDLVPEGSGLRVPVTTPEQITCDLARAVDRFADLNAEARSAMGRIGWEFARTLNYRAGAALFIDLYRQLLAGSPTLTALPTSVRHMHTATVEAD